MEFENTMIISNRGRIHLEIFNANFVYGTHFDRRNPNRFGKTGIATIQIPEEFAAQLSAAQVNTRCNTGTEEHPHDPIYSIQVIAKFDSDYDPPEINLVVPDPDGGIASMNQLDENTIGIIDKIRTSKVEGEFDIAPNKNTGLPGGIYIKRIWVTQDLDSDPFAARYGVN